MADLEWKEVEPESASSEKRIDLTAFYGEMTLASLLYQGEEIGWISLINQREEFLDAETEEDAKSELLEALISHYEDEINDDKSMLESLREFNGEEPAEPKYTKEQIEKAIRHFTSMRDDAVVVLDSGFGTGKGESDLFYRNRKMYAEIAIEAIREVYK